MNTVAVGTAAVGTAAADAESGGGRVARVVGFAWIVALWLGASAGWVEGKGAVEAEADANEAHAAGYDSTRTETMYLSGVGPTTAVPWRFRCSAGRGCGVWTTIRVPSNWELEGFGRFDYGYRDDKRPESADYALTFTVPESWRGRSILLVFEGVMTDASVALDGVQLGTHQGAFTPFSFDITSRVRFGADHELTVRVDEGSANESVNRAERDADYWVFGGIYRPVYLAAHPSTRIDHVAVDARHDGHLSLRVEVDARGLANDLPQGAGVGESRAGAGLEVFAVVRERADGSVRGQLRGVVGAAADPLVVEPGVELGGRHLADLAGSVAGVQPWSAEHPTLYDLEVTLERRGTPEHRVSRQIGFRSVEVRAGAGLFVNGRRVRLKGVNRHSFWPTTGRALDPLRNRQDAALIKSLNANAVRASHYPPDRAFLDACDEVGLFVIDELPGWKESFDTEVGARLVTEMVRHDGHHPAIILWANGNEGGWNEALDDLYGQLDLARRPVIHPDERFGGFDTEHYPTWRELRDRLLPATDWQTRWRNPWRNLWRPNDGALVLPTEMLHGLYDGGGGAGLADYWALLEASPRGVGGFLWALFDEGVVRVDKGGGIDTAGSDAADGIVDPWRQPEPSFAAVRRIWSPVRIDEGQLLHRALDLVAPDARGDDRAAVAVAISNRFDETDLAAVRFDYRWRDVPEPWSEQLPRVHGEGTLPGPPVVPGGEGLLQVPVPTQLMRGHAPDWLELEAFDARDRPLGEWSLATARQAFWVRRAVAQARRAAASVSRPLVEVEEEDGAILLRAGRRFVRIDRDSGMLVALGLGARTISLAGGPRPLGARDGTAVAVRVVEASAQRNGQAAIEVSRAGDLGQVRWALDPSGWLRLSYQIEDDGRSPFLGIGFDLDEQALGMLEVFGRQGRVWGNRPSGGPLAVSPIDLSNEEARQVAAGFYSQPYWLRLDTDDGPLVIAVESDQLSLGLGVPRFPEDARTAIATVPLASEPGTSLSFLHRLPAIGTKFHHPRQLAPPGAVFPGLLRASLWFYIPDG